MEKHYDFNSEADEAKYWDEHISEIRIADDDEEGGEFAFSPQLRKDRNLKLTFMRLPQEMIDALQEIAEVKDISHQTLMRDWLVERLAQEQKRARV